ncbi:MAG: GntR family transcriptional regulator [Segetibacter sp.]
MLENIKIDINSSIPKYKQIIDSIHEALENNMLEKNEKIASINEICNKFSLSRDTVLTALGHLQSRGIMRIETRKGLLCKKIITTQKHKIFLLFDRLSPYKEVLYDSFKDQLKNNGTVEIFFHNFNFKIFETLIRDNLGSYTDYVIMPIPSKSITPILNLIPKDKLYILDRGRRLFGQDYSSVCQSFKKDIYNALDSGKDLLEKYDKLLLIYNDYGHPPMDLQRGFTEYCKEKIYHTQ